MSAIAIIPARGGSRRIPRKNIRLFYGKPIIAYSIETAQKSGLFDEVIVSSDDDEILTIAQKHGAGLIQRPDELARDDVGTQEVMKYALESIKNWHEFDFACCIYATAPLMSVKDLHNGFALLKYGQGAFVYSICGWKDAAQFYWGHADAFLADVPLDHWSTKRLYIEPERFCDINTEEDWSRAEQMYASLKGIT